MKLELNIQRHHLVFLIVAVLIVAGIGAATAYDPAKGWHPWSQIELPAGVWPGLNADMVDGKHADQLGGQLSCQIVNATGSNSAGVVCPSGTVCTGGGASYGPGNVDCDSFVTFITSYPYENGYMAYAACKPVTVYAVCCKID